MTKPHRIRLRGPWQVETDLDPALSTVKLPADWESLFGEQSGCARFSRRFNRPTGLEPADRVDLVLEGFGGRADISLNGRPLGAFEPTPNETRVEVTSLLELHNILSIQLEFTPEQGERGGLYRPVAIEIVPARS